MDLKFKKSIVSVDLKGKIKKTIIDDFELGKNIDDSSLLSLVDEYSKTKFLKFLLNVENEGTEVYWDINLIINSGIEKFFVTGIKSDGEIILLITKDFLNLDQIYEDFIKINNEQVNYFRNVLKKYEDDMKNSYKNYIELLDEISKLNNELSNAQRELIKKTYELEELNKKLEELTITDPLTELYNRRFFEKIFKSEVAKSKRHNIPLSVIFTDINNFKKVNDELGHIEGDRILKQLARTFSENVRKDVDYIFRFGGDEFLILLFGSTYEDSLKVIERISKKFTERTGLSIAYGIMQIETQNESTDIEEIIKKVDALMYKHKKTLKSS